MHPFIYINGFPGVGKLTVAHELQLLLPNSKLFHNHLFIDPIAAQGIDRSSPDYSTIRTEYRRHLLNKIVTSEPERTICIFTDSRCTSDLGQKAVEDYQDAAARRGVPLIPVIMTCDAEENARRVVDEGRRADGEGGKCTKLRDADVLRDIREKEEMYRLEG